MSQILETGDISANDLLGDLQKALEACIAAYPKAKLRVQQLSGGRSEQQKGSVKNLELILEWLGMESEICRKVLDDRGLLKEDAPAFDSASTSKRPKKVNFDLRQHDDDTGNTSIRDNNFSLLHQLSEDMKGPQPALAAYDILADTEYSKQRIDELISRFNRRVVPVMDDQTFCHLVKQLASTHGTTNIESQLRKRILSGGGGSQNEHFEKKQSTCKRRRLAANSEASGKAQMNGRDIGTENSLEEGNRL